MITKNYHSVLANLFFTVAAGINTWMLIFDVKLVIQGMAMPVWAGALAITLLALLVYRLLATLEVKQKDNAKSVKLSVDDRYRARLAQLTRQY
jgi:hypothetical protein